MIKAKSVLEELKKRGVTHVIGLPDNSSAALFELLRQDPDIRLVSVTREGEAFALAAGLWMGGKTPVVLIQNTGFLESGDAFRGAVSRMRVPLLCLITYRGHARMGDHPPQSQALTPDLLSRPDIDSVALVTAPTLRAWGIPFFTLTDDGNLDVIAQAMRHADESSHPVAVLITKSME